MKFSPSCTCCGNFVCEECSGDGETVPGCAVITMNGLSLTPDPGCDRHETFINDLLSGQFTLQGSYDSTNNVCVFSSKGYCGCSNLTYGHTQKVAAINSTTDLAEFGACFALAHSADGGNPGYVLEGLPNGPEDWGGGAPPDDYLYFTATKTQSTNDDCGDFPLTWLGVTVNKGGSAFSDGVWLSPSWTSADIAFSTNGCAGADCNQAVGVGCGDWGGHERALISPYYGWCDDRAPGSYDKKADGMTFTVPDDWDGGGATGGNVTITGEMQCDISGYYLWLNAYSVGVGDIGDVGFISGTGTGTNHKITLTGNSPYGTEVFTKSSTESWCNHTRGFPCDEMEGTYTGTHGNITSVVITEV